ncbi:Retrovirus-related Pol polyprotein from transposon 17.6 Protease [Larimichthys crocea]|uniref:Gypsy retrotransposon integrase-like protein 1 n=1 Tax=Larimichthys crocea TaxID=215358 RepID=A0A6G0IJ19_LARCR|nr:Retrovirus-related Pol polyprotein from transposon 17.6 Protease [Larimichthys crocea]
MESVKPPEPLNWTGNVDCEWQTFKQRFKLYLQALGLDTKSDARKIALLLTVAGPQAVEVYNTFVFAERDHQEQFDMVVEKFDEHCSPKKNETFERYVFRSRMQVQGESFDAFVTDLKLKARTCNFGNLKDSMIRDQIVFGVIDKKVRERLLREPELKLADAIKIGNASELAKQHAKTFSGQKDQESATAHVAAVHKQIQRQKKQSKPQKDTETFSCKRCGNQHAPKQCPAFGKTCSKCKGKNHFAKQCFSKGKQSGSDRVHTVEETELADSFFVGMVAQDEDGMAAQPKDIEQCTNANCAGKDKWSVPLEINGAVIPLKLDTGAKANLISECDIRAMKVRPRIHPSPVKLKAYNGHNIDTKGTCKLKVKIKEKEHHLMFVVVPDGHDSLLGDTACENLGLVRRVYCLNNVNSQTSVETIVNQYPDIFKGFGVLPFTYKIQLKDDAQPVVHAPRRIPAPLRGKLKQELDRMLSLGVIRKVEEPTEWVNSMVCVRKTNGELRVCMDPKDLNNNIKREHYQIPTRDEITSEMAGAKYFSKLDASQGFWQLKLHEDSTKYCTFNTPYGRYCFQRMPFGICSAPEVFHRTMEHIIEGIEGVRVYVDDLILWGSTLEQHNERLIKVLQRVQKYQLKLNRSKCQFGVNEITFLGDKLSAAGVEPDRSKIKAILDMPRPEDKKGVLRALGMINFIGKFIPNLSSKTVHLRELLRDRCEFKWTSEHEAEWSRLKTTLTTEPVLTFFDPSERIKISTDSSKDGIGAVLLQTSGEDWKPVAYASRTMTSAECRYAQIEKECLGLVYGFQKFHGYVYGLPKFVAETDHKPLIAIIKKNLGEMSPRIQRLMMKLQRYDFDLIYTPGKHIVVADALSRAVTQSEEHDECSTEKEVNLHVNLITETLPMSDMKSRLIADETKKDVGLQRVIQLMNEDWPRGECQQYYNIRGELSLVNGLLLRKNRIVIPQSLRPDMLKRLHEGHLGMEKCKRRARTSIYWPSINADIDRMVSRCATCLKHQAKQAKEPMAITEIPDEPWQKVGTDLFYLDGKNYLLVIDYLSNYPEIALLPNMSAACVIKHMKSIFARHGIPQVVYSDNGPSYSCKEFQDFAQEYDFCHVTSSPLYAQSNGKAEKGVHIVKQLLKKAQESHSDPYLALLSYRASPLEHGLSPAEILMGRRLRTTLPYTSEQKQKEVKQKLKDLQKRQKANYDKSTKSLVPLARHDTVRIHDSSTWSKKATVLEEVSPRSYNVKTEDGQVLRRNRRSLLKTQDTWQEQTEEDSKGDPASTTSEDPLPDDHQRAVETDLPVLRRSSRPVKAPDRLNL